MYNLVRESISFTRGGDPKESMGIGRRSFIKKWLNDYNVFRYYINEDMTINVYGVVDLVNKYLNEFPEFIQFNEVDGGFYCFYNSLTTLRGCPGWIGGDFHCSDNNLISLEGGPKNVEGDFGCRRNSKKFIVDDVRDYCKVKGNIFV